jgi:dTMP kinase
VQRKGFFITFESIDGVGKTTQLFQLGKALEDAGHDIFYTKEPGDKSYGSVIGQGVRDLLFKTAKTQNLAPGVGDLLFLADHIQTQADIKSALRYNKVVLCDRFADSQFAYSASATKKAPQWANDLFAKQTTILPDMTVLMVARGRETYRADGDSTKECQTGRYRSTPLEDISWALVRANERKGIEVGKQDGKAWNDVEEQRKIQNAYLLQLAGLERTFIVDAWKESTIGDLHQLILVEVLRRIAVKETPLEPGLYLPFETEADNNTTSRA